MVVAGPFQTGVVLMRQFVKRNAEASWILLADKVPGDVLDAGVWRGGMGIFMRACLKADWINDPKVWVADSFAGLPEIDRSVDKFSWNAGDMAVSLDDRSTGCLLEEA